MKERERWIRMNVKIIFTSLIIGLGLIGVSTAFAANLLEECDGNWIPQITLCYVVKIYHQNEQIIEKLDWNNCAIQNKSSFEYSFSKEFLKFDRANSHEDLIERCGELP